MASTSAVASARSPLVARPASKGRVWRRWLWLLVVLGLCATACANSEERLTRELEAHPLATPTLSFAEPTIQSIRVFDQSTGLSNGRRDLALSIWWEQLDVAQVEDARDELFAQAEELGYVFGQVSTGTYRAEPVHPMVGTIWISHSSFSIEFRIEERLD